MKLLSLCSCCCRCCRCCSCEIIIIIEVFHLDLCVWDFVPFYKDIKKRFYVIFSPLTLIYLAIYYTLMAYSWTFLFDKACHQWICTIIIWWIVFYHSLISPVYFRKNKVELLISLNKIIHHSVQDISWCMASRNKVRKAHFPFRMWKCSFTFSVRMCFCTKGNKA